MNVLLLKAFETEDWASSWIIIASSGFSSELSAAGPSCGASAASACYTISDKLITSASLSLLTISKIFLRCAFATELVLTDAVWDRAGLEWLIFSLKSYVLSYVPHCLLRVCKFFWVRPLL